MAIVSLPGSNNTIAGMGRPPGALAPSGPISVNGSLLDQLTAHFLAGGQAGLNGAKPPVGTPPFALPHANTGDAQPGTRQRLRRWMMRCVRRRAHDDRRAAQRVRALGIQLRAAGRSWAAHD